VRCQSFNDNECITGVYYRAEAPLTEEFNKNLLTGKSIPDAQKTLKSQTVVINLHLVEGTLK
jgi:hypothetical protein